LSPARSAIVLACVLSSTSAAIASSPQQPAASAVDEIHRQGGIAIAAHPLQRSWDGYDAAAIERLDGAEVCHPIIYGDDSTQAQLERFAARGTAAAIGSSDFHGRRD